MIHKMIKINGKYVDEGKVKLESGKIINWEQLNLKDPPKIPYGSSIEVIFSFEEKDYLLGKDGIVWATYDKRQAEIIQTTLLTQNIAIELEEENLGDHNLFLLHVLEKKELQNAIDFVWKNPGGLNLKPDWHYPIGEANKSFEKWLNE